MEDVSGGQALRDRAGLIFVVWTSQQATVDLMYLLCCGFKSGPWFLSRIITSLFPHLFFITLHNTIETVQICHENISSL